MSNRADLIAARDATELLEGKLAAVEVRVESSGASLRIGRARAMLRGAAGEISRALNLPVDIAALPEAS